MKESDYKCKKCGSINIIEEIKFFRGNNKKNKVEWKQITQRCSDCGSIKTYTEK